MKTLSPLSSAVCAALLLAAAQIHANAPPGRYIVDATGVVTDQHTKLVWQRTAAPGPMYWREAIMHCMELDLAGRGWRLPKYKELMTLVDFTRSKPAIDTEAFPDAPAEAFWTDSKYVEDDKLHYWVDFNTGAGSKEDPNMLGPDRMLRVRCVR